VERQAVRGVSPSRSHGSDHKGTDHKGIDQENGRRAATHLHPRKTARITNAFGIVTAAV
jgi:hypothetical protein